MALILASTSKYRKSLLMRLGVVFSQADPGPAEEGVSVEGLSPAQIAMVRARAKAEAVQRLHPNDLIIGSDQVCALGEDILGKPGSAAANREQLGRMQGSVHELLTAVVLMGPEGVDEHLEVASLTMNAMDKAAIARYVERDQAFDCAGGYKLECAGIALFERITTADHTAIEGLPLIATARLLRGRGIQIP